MARVARLILALLVALPALAGELVLHNATVIDGTGAPARPSTDVVIRGEQIVEVSSDCRHLRGARVIDATGKFVIPGLVDMHAHILLHPWTESGDIAPRYDRPAMLAMLRTLLAFGVTTIRDPGAPTAEAVTLKRLLAEGKVEGPRLFTAGRILNASNFSPEPFAPMRDEAAIRDEIRWQANAGVDLIKVYSSMPPALVQVAIDEAHKHGLPIIGHVQRTTWTEAARLGIDGLEHAMPWSVDYVRETDRAAYDGSLFARAYWLTHLDEQRIDEMIAELAKRKVVVDSTLMAMHTKFWGDDPRYTASPDLQHMPEVWRKGWPAGSFTSRWTPEQYAAAKQSWPILLRLTRRLHDAGVPLVAGTDTPTPWTVPGASLHDELRLLRDAGIPPLAILRIATHNAARALRRDHEFGSIRKGLRADLVVLDANPLTKIEHTRAIAMVIQRGRVVAGR